MWKLTCKSESKKIVFYLFDKKRYKICEMNEKVKVEKRKKQSCGVSLWCDKLNKHLQERQEKAEEKFALERKRPRGKEVNQAKYQHFNHNNARNFYHITLLRKYWK